MKRKKKVPATCVNGCPAPVQAPSKVLCKKCLEILDKRMRALLGEAPGPATGESEDEV